MEKFGVVLDDTHMKVAEKAGQKCPGCGSTNVNYKGLTPQCDTCGTKPWEPQPHGSKKEDFRR